MKVIGFPKSLVNILVSRSRENVALQTNETYCYNSEVVSRCAFCIFWVFCSVNHLSGPLKKTHIYWHEFKRSWFMIHDWRISIRFVCFAFQGSLLCDRPVSGNNRLVLT